MAQAARRIVTRMLDQAGIQVNGPDPRDFRVHDERVFGRILGHGSLGLGEAYMDGWWDTECIDGFFERILDAGLDRRIRLTPSMILNGLKYRLLNLQSPHRAFQVGQRHYDAGNDLFRRMLDRRMVYSCGYWKNADNLDTAQEHKLELICRKLGLAPGMRLLDIGCGWGSLVRYAARHHGVEALGITVSREQAEVARENCRGLPVAIELKDYRALEGRFDRIASVGMVEHVGWKNYSTFMDAALGCLEPGGLFLLHTIGSNISRRGVDPWIARYIFPNGMLPSPAQITRAAEGRFFVEDVHNFGPDYDATLMAWEERFSRTWPEIADSYDLRFFRMWRYYLHSCAAAFRTRHIQLFQFLLSRPPRPQVPEGARAE